MTDDIVSAPSSTKRLPAPPAKVVFSALGGAALFLLVFFLIHLPHGPEHWSADLRTAFLSRQLDKQHDRIAMVEITNDTLESYPYLSPIDRKLLADLIRTIDASEPKAIGLDFVFDHATERSKDDELLQAIRDAHAPIVLGALDDDTLPEPARRFQSDFLKDTQRPAGHLYLGEERGNPLIISEHVIRMIATPSVAGRVRTSFAEVLAGLDGSSHQVDDGRLIAWLLPPRTEKRSLFLWLWAPESGIETFLTLPVDQLLVHDKNGLPIETLLRNRFVLIGANFPDRDQHLTPLSVWSEARFSGLFIHAQILAQLLADESLHELSWQKYIALLLAVGAFGIWTGRRERSGHRDLWIELVSVIVLIVISILAFKYGRFIFPFISVLLAWSAGIAAGHFSKRAPEAQHS
jgi:CHASE2 domain-containing sensor protein